MKYPRFVATASVGTLLALSIASGQGASLPDYAPKETITGPLRTWGSHEMSSLMKLWEQGFAKYHPKVTFADHLSGNESAQVPLAFRVADLALVDRELLSNEWYNMFQRRHYFATVVSVGTGSDHLAKKTYALAILVNRNNPVASLTLKQLDGIFGEQRKGAWEDSKIAWRPARARGPEANIRTWGQAGATGDWADKPVHPFGYPTVDVGAGDGDVGAVETFRNAVLSGSNKWNPELREYPTGPQLTAALSRDPYGIGYAPLECKTADLKPVALAGEGGPAVTLNPQTVGNRTYPLARSISISIGRPPGGPAQPNVREFLRYVLSRQGQDDVARDGNYLPLTAALAAQELKKVE